MNNKLLFYCIGVIAVYIAVVIVKSSNKATDKKNETEKQPEIDLEQDDRVTVPVSTAGIKTYTM